MITRRNAITLGASICFAAAQPYSMANNIISADTWMQEWIDRAAVKDANDRKGAKGALHVGRFADPIYYLLSTIGWDPEGDAMRRFKSVRVPVGFVTDLASVPQIFWSLLRPDGLYSYAAIIHDYLYWEQYLSREDCDEILRLAMIDFKVPASQATAIHLAVRVGGEGAWAENARLKDAGERRLLKVMPDDPLVRWNDWKQQAVFY